VHSFQFFSPVHLCILAAVPLLAALLTLVQRRFSPGSKILRVFLGSILLLDSAAYYFTLAASGQLTIPDHLPLELCDASLCLVILALFTLNGFVYDLAYYGALAGATMALVTPNVSGPFPSFWTVQFFIDHGLIVAGALYLVWSGQARPRKGSVLRAMLWLNIYAAFVGTFDWIFKTNYMYLRTKPQNGSLLNFLGPWPWYILATEGVALVVFGLLYLPFRSADAVPQPQAEISRET
jgi:hypothetical integral membrane protein (TIGR02206 family)